MSLDSAFIRAILVLTVLASSIGTSACQTPAGPSSAQSLDGTHWKAIALAGNPVSALDSAREAHLLFDATNRVSGSDGCNQLAGSYDLEGDAITFGRMAATRMACANTAGTERAFHDALSRTTRLRMRGDRLELLSADGTPLAAFEAIR
jgi:heat shock protein HslJ